MKDERRYIARAITLAKRALGHTRPNPPVGAVIIKAGKIVAEGWHKRAGGDHAEVDALKKAGAKARGATLYVSLEPCSKPGRVGACTDAIIKAGIKRVVYACDDPNEKNRGKASQVLAKAGIPCSCTQDEALRKRARELIRAFAKHVTSSIPYVTVKLAMSLDGKICDDEGCARWISSEEARRRTGKLREQVDAIMVGGETVRKDNPSLLSHGKRNDDLVRVVISRSGNLPGNAQILTDSAPNETLVFDDAKKALRELGARGIMHVLCEGGLKLATYLAQEGLVDEWICVVAPKVIGPRAIGEAVRIERMICLQDSSRS